MGDVINNPNQNSVQYNSENIGKKPETEYFVKTRQRFSFRRVFDSLNNMPLLKGWRKFAILAFILAAIAAVIIIISINSGSQTKQQDIVQDLSYTETANAVYKEAVRVSQSASDTAYFDALTVFDNAVAEHDSADVKNEIIYMKAEFYHINSADNDAIALLLELKGKDGLTATQQSKVFSLLISIYQANENTESADKLLTEYNNLYPGGQ
jgi:hypothetical protein